MENIVLLTKDAMHRGYLPIYGNKYWKTPNIDELAAKGTVFQKCYTGAPSTVMSNMCMFTSKYPHESELSDYTFSKIRYSGETLFDYAASLGYECHIVWDEAWTTEFRMEERYYCYGKETTIHKVKGFRQGVGAHYKHKGMLKPDAKKTDHVFFAITELLQDILSHSKPVFLWLHVPHVINGRVGYGQDIDVFDHIVGLLRNYFSDNNIFIAADHGNMNSVKGKLQYGHDVYEPNSHIPLIAPRIDNLAVYEDVFSNIDLKTLIFNRTIPRREYVFSDTAFYGQPNRKLAIITKEYKYIYNKIDGTEELYDLFYDPHEDANLLQDEVYDVDRHCASPFRELYFYPCWDRIGDITEYFRNIKNEMWKTAGKKAERIPRLKYLYKVNIYGKMQQIKMRRKYKK